MPSVPTGKPWTYYLSHLAILVGVAIVGAGFLSLLGLGAGTLMFPELDFNQMVEDPRILWNYPVMQFVIMGLSTIGAFLLPALIYPMLVGKRTFEFFPLGAPVPAVLMLLAVLLSFLAMNPTALLAELNNLFDVSRWGSFGDWMVEQEQSNLELYGKALKQEGWAGLMASFLVVALIPSICEELAFRGVLQRLLQSWSGRHAGIIITAIAFSAIHLEFSGFLPRVFLGLFLGYVFFWTGNLWFSITIHFVNNLFIVILARFYSAEELNVNEIGTPTLIMAALGTIVFTGFLYFFYRLSLRSRRHGEELGQDLHHEPATDS
jgi:membrane protease YdiL (CAAX protease family)